MKAPNRCVGRPFGALLCTLLTACAVGPPYVPPATPEGAARSFVSATPSSSSDQPLPTNWWRLYNDPVLDRLVTEALAENADLKTAAANLEAAQAQLEQTRAGLFPSTEISAGDSYGKAASANLPGGASTVAHWTSSAGFTAAYEVDLFGRIRRSIEAARASSEAQADAENVVRVAVAAETAGAYANVCAFAEQAAVARHSLAVVQQTYDTLVRERAAGAVSDLDLAREATLVDQARAAVPTLDGQRRAALFELAALLGRTPSRVPADAAACTTTPRIAQPLPVGDGAALLRRRPDVREADRQVAAATARIGVATANLYPTVSLNGAVNSVGGPGAALGSSRALSFSVGPLLTWSFPNILVARAEVGQANAQTQAAIASFDSTVLAALKETEQALTAYAGELDRHAALAAADDHAKQAFDLAHTQYNIGAISFLDLLTAETSLVQADQQLAVSDQAVAADQVAVFQALGGGWESAPAITPPPVPRG
ncbi:MAG: efflux transporter outer membrane subunit [Caulobacterales bacterium]